MNRSRFLALGGVSLLVGAVFSFYVYSNLEAKSSQPMHNAIVAAKDLQIGTRLERADIQIVRVPPSIIPPDSRQRPEDVVGRGVIVPIAKGQFIVSAAYPTGISSGVTWGSFREVPALDDRCLRNTSDLRFVGHGSS